MRDVSKSNRLKYLLDDKNKFVILKQKMVIGIGMTEDYFIYVEQIGWSENHNINVS
jgi:hypothetical protein